MFRFDIEMLLRTRFNEQELARFIDNHQGANIVSQLQKSYANEDLEGCIQLFSYIDSVTSSENKIGRMKRRIESHKESIKDIEREMREEENRLKNGLNYHKIKRSN